MRGVKTKDQGKWKRLGIFLILFLVFGVLSNSASKVYKKKEGAEKALTRMEEEIQTLENRKKFLASTLERLNTEEGVEFEIRKKLNVAEVGESVALIINEETPTSTIPISPSSWQKFKNFFVELFK